MKEYIKPEFSFVAVMFEGAVICNTFQDNVRPVDPGDSEGGDGLDYVESSPFRPGIWDDEE